MTTTPDAGRFLPGIRCPTCRGKVPNPFELLAHQHDAHGVHNRATCGAAGHDMREHLQPQAGADDENL